MNRTGWMLAIGVMLGLLMGQESIQSATREVVDTDSPQTLSNKTIVGVFPTGGVISFGGASAPAGYLLCDGAAVSRTTYAGLFAVLGTTYGAGDGSTTFNLPDLRGRAPLGAGQGTGLTNRTLGEMGGEETNTLTGNNIPNHGHIIRGTSGPHGDISLTSAGGTAGWGVGGPSWISGAYTYVTGNWTDTPPYYGQPGIPTGTYGGGQPHNIMQPYRVLNFIIKT